jgi:hypothetical protein
LPNLFQAHLESGSFARIPSAQLAAPNQSATKLAHSKYVTELMDGVLSSLLAKLFVVTVVGAVSLYTTQLNQ